jgi:FkbM family methyltransferase
MNIPLKVKAMLVATPLEDAAKTVQWLSHALGRSAHPELAELHLEGKRIAEVVKRLVSPTSSVLDVGCHIGSFLSLALKLSPNGKHVAIEAMPDKAAWLKRKFPRVRIEAIAVSDTCGEATFDQNLSYPGHSRLQDGTNSYGKLRSITVPTATLDSLDLGCFDLVKLDIEGAELNALKGATKLFSDCRSALIFECGVAEPGKQNPERLYRYITETMGYRIFNLVDFLYGKGPLSLDEMRKCGLYPFRGFNFVALPN